jgi:transposase
MRFVRSGRPSSKRRWMLHRARDLLVRQRTMLANAIHGYFAEFGIVAPRASGASPRPGADHPRPRRQRRSAARPSRGPVLPRHYDCFCYLPL